PGVSAEELSDLLQPLLDQLRNLGVNYTTPVVRQFPGYLEQFNAMMPQLEVAVAQYGGWLLPRSVVLDNPDGLAAAYENITNGRAGSFTSVALNVNRSVTGDVSNAVHPAWRTTLLDVIITTWVLTILYKSNAANLSLSDYNATKPTSLAEAVKQQEDMTNIYIPQLKALAPDSGVYLNE
ncbi:MAG: hypothetical protein Q9183_007364, partial [Haloplaca sp. 2 TL-2023]